MISRSAISIEAGHSALGTILFSAVGAQFSPGQLGRSASPAKAALVLTPYRNQPAWISNRAAAICGANWGSEAPSVKAVESGVLFRFDHRFLDPEKAKGLTDKNSASVLGRPEMHLSLVISSMGKVGKRARLPSPLWRGVLSDGIFQQGPPGKSHVISSTS
jgi:hypothetical protein